MSDDPLIVLSIALLTALIALIVFAFFEFKRNK